MWVATFGAGAILLLLAGGLAASAIVPRGFTVFHVNEIKGWLSASMLHREPFDVKGTVLYGHQLAIEGARAILKVKADRLVFATRIFGGALLCVVACGLSVAIHAAMYPDVHVSARPNGPQYEPPQQRSSERGREWRDHGGSRARTSRSSNAPRWTSP